MEELMWTGVEHNSEIEMICLQSKPEKWVIFYFLILYTGELTKDIVKWGETFAASPFSLVVVHCFYINFFYRHHESSNMRPLLVLDHWGKKK